MNKPKGHIYFLSHKDCPNVMVGRTRKADLDGIIGEMKKFSPTGDVIIRGVIEARNTREWYLKLSDRILPFRVSDGWYDLTQTDVDIECSRFESEYYESSHPEYKRSVDVWLSEMGWYPVSRMRDGQTIRKDCLYFLYCEWIGDGDSISRASFSKHLKELGFIFAYDFDSISVGGMQ